MPIDVSGSIINSASVKSYSFDKISTRGLILHLDASITDSYPESGTTWYDLSDKIENVDVLVVGGGGAGGHNGQGNDIAGGGGGAGGLVYQTNYRIDGSSGITVTVGNGGTGAPSAGGSTIPTNGENSVFGSITAIGGGKGGGYLTSPSQYYAASSGGSGGGGIYSTNAGGNGTSLQGYGGGSGTSNANPGAYAAGGGGGAAGVGADVNVSTGKGGDGGNGLQYDITGIPTYYAGGGGGGSGYQIAGKTPGTGGLGGGGNGSATGIGTAGTANTGGGAGGSGNVSGPPYPGAASANGGSGIVVVRYKGKPKATGGTITQHNNYTVHTFTSSGTFTPFAKQNATLVNGPTFSNGAIVLDGTSDYISLPVTGMAPSTLTQEMWVKLNATGNGANLVVIDNTDNPELRFRITAANKISISWYDDAAYLATFTSVSALTVGVWYHLTMTTQTNDFNLYINGVLDSSDASGTYTGGPSGNATEHTLGTYNRPGAGYEGYANVTYGIYRVYNRVLPAGEILNNYNIQKGRFGY
jgi:hypothetical protein